MFLLQFRSGSKCGEAMCDRCRQNASACAKPKLGTGTWCNSPHHLVIYTCVCVCMQEDLYAFTYTLQCGCVAGAVLGCAQHEEVPVVQRDVTKHPVWVWWPHPKLFRHQGHQEKPQLRRLCALLWRCEWTTSVGIDYSYRWGDKCTKSVGGLCKIR